MWQKRLEEMITKAAGEAFAYVDCLRHFEANLFYKPAVNGQWGELMISDDDPPGDWQLADPRLIRPNMSKDQMRSFINEVARRLPIIGE